MIVQADFTNVKDDFAPISEGVHVAIISDVELKDGPKAKYFNWEGTIQDGADKGQKIWWTTSLAPGALFNLRNMMKATGIEVPKTKFDIDTDLLLKRPIGLRTEQYLYEGKVKSKVTDFLSAQEAIALIKAGCNANVAPRVLTEEKRATTSSPAASVPAEPIDLGDMSSDEPPFKADTTAPAAPSAPAQSTPAPDIDLEGIDL